MVVKMVYRLLRDYIEGFMNILNVSSEHSKSEDSEKYITITLGSDSNSSSENSESGEYINYNINRKSDKYIDSFYKDYYLIKGKENSSSKENFPLMCNFFIY